MKPNKPKPTASGSTHHKSRRSVVPNPLFVEAAACATVGLLGEFIDCSGGLFLEAARCRSCASRTAGISLI